MKGVIWTRVGYSGGTKKNPTYYNLGDHTETVQIDYDPRQISYDKLLEIFWRAHEPTQRSWSRQYITAIFYHNKEQKRLAEESLNRLQAKMRSTIVTQILPATEFYTAEAYHQKYALRQDNGLMSEFAHIYPSDKDFMNSTAAARVNGYVSGYGSASEIEANVDRLGLSPEASKRLLDMAKRRRPR